MRRITTHEGCEGPSFLRAEKRVELPTFADQARESVNPWNLVDQSKIDVPRRIEVCRRVILIDVVRILIFRQKISATIRRPRVKASRPHKVKLPSQTV